MASRERRKQYFRAVSVMTFEPDAILHEEGRAVSNDDNCNSVPFPDWGSFVVITRQTGAPAAEQLLIYVNNHSTDEEHRRAADRPLFQICADRRRGTRLNCDLDNQVHHHLSWAPV